MILSTTYRFLLMFAMLQLIIGCNQRPQQKISLEKRETVAEVSKETFERLNNEQQSRDDTSATQGNS